MAIIQKIRDKYAKVAGGVIALSLIAFVLNDAFNGQSGSIFGGGDALAKVNGKKIEPLEFDQRVQEYNTVYSLKNPNAQISDDIRAQINDQAMRDLVNDKIIDEQLSKLGITISAKEENDLIYGANPSGMVQQYPVFTNPETGMFDQSRIKAYEDQLKNPPKDADQKLIEKEIENWNNFKSFVKHQNKQQKFNNLVVASMYAPKFMVDYKMTQQNEIASIKIVKIPVTVIPDNEAIISDADINSYMEKHKKRFQIDQEMRGLHYVSFDVVPSKEDTATAQNALQNLKSEFAAIPNTEVENFVTQNSEEAYRDYYFTKKTFKSPFADSILGHAEGYVYGPYLENGSFLMVKILENRSLPDSVKAQHILVQPSQSMDDSATHKLADSIKLAIESGVSFDSLAAKFSVDKQNNQKGGDLGYFIYGSMVPEFNEFAFMGKTGDLKVVKSQYGYHIARINDQKNYQTATKMAILVKSLYPSDLTETNVFTRANEFATKYKTAKAFDDGVKAMGLQKKEADNVKIQDFSVQGIGPARQLVSWIYNAKQGDVSAPLDIKTTTAHRYIIAKLTSVQAKGMLKLNDAIKPQIESIVRGEKKADLIAAKYKSQTTLEGIAQASGQTILSADSFTSTTPYLNNIGYEPKAIGYAFSKQVKPGTLCPPMKGQDAVTYMVLVSRVPKMPNPNEAAVFQQQQMTEQEQMQKSIGSTLQEMLMRKSDVKFYNNSLR